MCYQKSRQCSNFCLVIFLTAFWIRIQIRPIYCSWLIRSPKFLNQLAFIPPSPCLLSYIYTHTQLHTICFLKKFGHLSYTVFIVQSLLIASSSCLFSFCFWSRFRFVHWLVFIPIPKKDSAKECSNYCAVVLISHASKVMLKVCQPRLQQYVNWEPPDIQLDLEKAEEPEIKLPTSIGSWKKQESSRKKSTSASLTTLKSLCHNKLWKILEEIGIPDHLTCLLRNLYAGQEATGRTEHGTTDLLNLERNTSRLYIITLLI